jgi:hypothetical protein
MQVMWSAMREYSDSSVRRYFVRGVLDRRAVREVVDQRRAVVQAVDVRDQVVPGVRLALLLEPPVQVAAVHVAADDPLAVELGDDLDRAVGGRMGRADVDDDVLVGRRLVERRPDRVRQLQFTHVHHWNPSRYGTSGCSSSFA